MPNSKTTSMSASHKAALAAGRAEGRAVRAYLTALDRNRPKRGRRRTLESIEAQLAEIESQLGSAAPVKRLELVQRRKDLAREAEAMQAGDDLGELEAGFVKVAKAYSERKGIEYSSWREVGVPAATLAAAGIGRSG